MTKRALCVGINDYPVRDMDLKGCVNDAKDWAALLVDHYDFARSDVTMLLDGHATKAAIVDNLKSLLAGARRGDVLVFTNSSHGTYVADTDGDEARYDEAMCPWDTKDNLLTDDELRELIAGLKAGARLTVISDSCHSGTVTRAMPGVPTPDQRRVRFLHPRRIGLPVIADVRRNAHSQRLDKHPESAMGELLLSGCRDDQFSFDAKFGRRFSGAMTNTALRLIAAAGYQLTWSELHAALVPAVRAAGYDQEPQLEGKAANRRRQLFT